MVSSPLLIIVNGLISLIIMENIRSISMFHAYIKPIPIKSPLAHCFIHPFASSLFPDPTIFYIKSHSSVMFVDQVTIVLLLTIIEHHSKYY